MKDNEFPKIIALAGTMSDLSNHISIEVSKAEIKREKKRERDERDEREGIMITSLLTPHFSPHL